MLTRSLWRAPSRFHSQNSFCIYYCGQRRLEEAFQSGSSRWAIAKTKSVFWTDGMGLDGTPVKYFTFPLWRWDPLLTCRYMHVTSAGLSVTYLYLSAYLYCFSHILTGTIFLWLCQLYFMEFDRYACDVTWRHLVSPLVRSAACWATWSTCVSRNMDTDTHTKMYFQGSQKMFKVVKCIFLKKRRSAFRLMVVHCCTIFLCCLGAEI